ncbi:complement C1q-like protein 4 [Mytilus trossulus]|uniref:complement C1q-like protein 4 n=1 Tax=Mytilus trossulus TaxID=6551 RepID=UPI0030074654
MFVFIYLSVWILCREMTMIHGSKLGDRSSDVSVSGFSASVRTGKYLVRGQIVRFDKVWSNIGNDYDPQSGIYTAPQGGAYHFSCTVMSSGNTVIRVSLMKNNLRTVANFARGSNSATLNIVLDLKEGDKICIRQVHYGNYIYSEPSYNFSMFSGFLIA